MKHLLLVLLVVTPNIYSTEYLARYLETGSISAKTKEEFQRDVLFGERILACLKHFAAQNNTKTDLFLPAANLLFGRDNDKRLIFCVKDSCIFNAGLYKYNARIDQEDLINGKSFISCAVEALQACNKIITISAPGASKHTYLRSHGKNFTTDTSIKSALDQTADDRIKYWKTVLMPTIFPETYQRGPFLTPTVFLEKYQVGMQIKKTWRVKELKDCSFTLLLCLHRLYPKNYIPRVLLNHHIFPATFSQAFDAINKRFCTVENDMLSQLEKIKKLEIYSSEITADQREFFENFHSWYPEQANAVLSKRFAIVQQLIAFHNKALEE